MSNIKLTAECDEKGTMALYKNKKVVTKVKIQKDVNMEIGVGEGFDGGAKVSAFSLFENINGAKGKSIGTWTRTKPSDQPSTEISVDEDGPAAILVTDTDHQDYDGLFFFSVEVTDDNASYDTDPELQVKKLGG